MSKKRLAKTDVELVAKLANISLTDKEIDKFADQLSSVVDFISELEIVETRDVSPTSQTTGLENVVREDIIDATQCLSQKDALSGSDKTTNGYFTVPLTIEGRTL